MVVPGKKAPYGLYAARKLKRKRLKLFLLSFLAA